MLNNITHIFIYILVTLVAYIILKMDVREYQKNKKLKKIKEEIEEMWKDIEVTDESVPMDLA